jgi:hypothetical protein
VTDTLQPAPGFPWDRVRWDDAHAPVQDECSLCGVAIDDDTVALRMWNRRGDSAVFCDPCSARWFGLQLREDDDG